MFSNKIVKVYAGKLNISFFMLQWFNRHQHNLVTKVWEIWEKRLNIFLQKYFWDESYLKMYKRNLHNIMCKLSADTWGKKVANAKIVSISNILEKKIYTNVQH